MRFVSSVLLLILVVCSFASPASVLSDLRQINAFPPHSSNIRQQTTSFDITGQVISKHHVRTSNSCVRVLTLIDKTHRIHLAVPGETGDWEIGDVIHALGQVTRGISSNGVFASSIERISNRAIPTPLPFGQLHNVPPDNAIHPIYANGIITDVFHDDLSDHFFWIVLETRTGPINAYASTDEYSFSEIRQLIDAEVELRGIYSLTHNNWRNTKNTLQLFGRDGIVVTKMPNTDPFLAPAFPSDSAHRLVISGTVKGKPRNGLFINTQNNLFVHAHLSASAEGVSIGDTVSVVGFPKQNRYGLNFLQAIVRKTGHSGCQFEQPIPVTGTQLAIDPIGREPVNYRYHGKVIKIKGRIRGTQHNDQASGIFRIDSEQQEIEVDYSDAFPTIPPSHEQGSVIEVTGICSVEFETIGSGLSIPRFRRYLVTLRTPDDIRLIARPQWWTPSKLIVVIILLIALIIVISFWNKSLKIHAERRGRELAAEKIAHMQAEIKVEERTRLAVELHDSISQTITGVAFQIDTAIAANGGKSTEIDAILGTSRQMLSSCRKALQSCLWDLRCRTFEEKDLTEAIRKAIEPHVGKITTHIRFNVPRATLSESATHAILKIIRELVANAIRHGKATEIRIAGELHDRLVNFSVRDNGSGFTPGSALGPKQGHFGLQGIRERLSEYGGSFSIDSAPGKGAHFTVSLPVTQDDTP